MCAMPGIGSAGVNGYSRKRSRVGLELKRGDVDAVLDIVDAAHDLLGDPLEALLRN